MLGCAEVLNLLNERAFGRPLAPLGGKTRSLLMFLVFSIVSGLLVVFLTAQNVLLAIMISLLIVVPLHRYAQTRDPFDILQMVSVGFIFYYVFGGIFLQIIGTGWGKVDLTMVYLGVILGYVAFCSAYYSRAGDALLQRLPWGRKINRRRLLSLASILLIVTILSGIYLGSREIPLPPTVTGVLKNAGHLSKLASLLLLANYLIRPKFKSFLLLLVALVVALWHEVFVFEVERRTVLRWVITLLVYWHYRGRRFKLTTLFVLAVLGLILIFVLSVIPGFYHHPTSQWSLDLFFEILDRRLARFDSQLVSIARSFESPIAVENFALVIEGIRSGQLDLLWGDSYSRFFLAFVPREIWPDKPLHIGRQIPVLVQSSSGAGALPVTILGEMYFNFGYVGILGSMVFLGVLCKFLYLLLMRSTEDNLHSSISATLIYAISAGFVLQYFRGGFHLVALEYLLFNMLPLLVGIRFFSMSSRSVSCRPSR